MRRVGKVLDSRRFFRNWMQLAINDLRLEPGLIHGMLGLREESKEEMRVKCRTGGEAIITPLMYRLILSWRNSIKSIYCSDGLRLYTRRDDWVSFKFEQGHYVINGVKFKQPYTTLQEVFLEKAYGDDNYGKSILDIGAYVGDTALYFASTGARHVYAVEPHPIAYNELLENIKLNNHNWRIATLNAGVSHIPGKLRIRLAGLETIKGQNYRDNPPQGDDVELITLSDLKDRVIKAFPDFGFDVLKMDCEGCEYDIILNNYGEVRQFREIIMEAHPINGRKITDLLKQLRSDYECNDAIDADLNAMIHCHRVT